MESLAQIHHTSSSNGDGYSLDCYFHRIDLIRSDQSLSRAVVSKRSDMPVALGIRAEQPPHGPQRLHPPRALTPLLGHGQLAPAVQFQFTSRRFRAAHDRSTADR